MLCESRLFNPPVVAYDASKSGTNWSYGFSRALAAWGEFVASVFFGITILLRDEAHFGDLELAEGVHDVDHALVVHFVGAFDHDA